MKLTLVGIAFLLAALGTKAAPITPLERQRLVAHLEMTGSWLIDEVSGLSAAQLRFRPSPGAWSILENVEHLAITDPIYWRQFQEAMKAPPKGTPDPARDADTLWYGVDRANRAPAIPSEDIKGSPRDPGAGLEIFRRVHREMLQYARTTGEDLRSHYVERERCDAYQWLLLISTHAQRHILQIREIKADPKFPEK
ncbi:MAG TPA: DinB family protein [Bryobacteraceae bacterium]|nr:DinB family protein [Bryobacteraceae bacterium]